MLSIKDGDLGVELVQVLSLQLACDHLVQVLRSSRWGSPLKENYLSSQLFFFSSETCSLGSFFWAASHFLMQLGMWMVMLLVPKSLPQM